MTKKRRKSISLARMKVFEAEQAEKLRAALGLMTGEGKTT